VLVPEEDLFRPRLLIYIVSYFNHFVNTNPVQKFSWSSLPKPIIALSPMADHTDAAFCILVKELAPSTVVFREMVSAEAMLRENQKTNQMATIHDAERPLIQQIFGGEPRAMAAAAKMIEERYHPDGIDINMGCPARKIVSNFNGSALMRQPELAAEIVRSVKTVVSVPVSVKMRLGWKKPDEVLDFAPIIEAAGADLISVHGRTKDQGYSGKANWEMIRRAKEKLSIPVLGNGDIVSVEMALKALKTGVDGILIGRGALGNPWIFRDIADALAGREPRVVDLEERVRVIRHHAELFLKLDFRDNLMAFRKHLIWYFKGIPGAAAIRNSIASLKTMEELGVLLKRIK
jgi:nifR3 family TIM-barrel protein